MRTRVLSVVVSIVLFIDLSTCFNLDTDFPIIYIDPSGNSGRGSYFGYSVILYEGSGFTIPWIQIGAPRGNNSFYNDYNEPGIVYRCPIKGACKLFPVDPYGKRDTKGQTPTGPYKIKKDGAWIGGHMDINSQFGRVVVCGHRWINTFLLREWLITGACYWSTISENGTQSLLPLVNRKNYIHNKQIYNYAMGQAGMAVHLPAYSDKAELLLGAPGILNWQGSPILYRDSDLIPSEATHFSNLNIPDMSQIAELQSFAYFGYSISSGYFNSRQELLYVAGAPRSMMYKGQIVIFNFGKQNGTNLLVKYTRSGTMVGEYFGAAIAVANVNGDDFDDIIVGAPHYSSNCDEGRVYVFLGNNLGNLLLPDQSAIIDGQMYAGQFGLAIQSLGDIDLDGYADVAVSAPYEDDMHGVVYIYNGSPKGLSLKPSQKIIGRQLFPTLKGFGISFSRPTDIDQNHYHDIAVGSYLSNHAVLLRTRPVVKLEMRVESEVAKLNSDATRFVIKICHSYSGSFLPPSLVVNRTLTIDGAQNRAYVKHNSAVTEQYAKVITVREMTDNCENITIYMKNKIVNFVEPIDIAVSQELVESEVKHSPILVAETIQNRDKFCKSCPIVHPTLSEAEKKIEVPFAPDCGDDNVCEADLKVSGSFVGLSVENNFVIGAKKSLPLEIIVTNIAEPAYLTQVEVTLPECINLKNVPSCCSERIENRTLVVVVLCDIDNPLRTNDQKNVTLNLDLSDINNIGHNLSFKIVAISRSDDLEPKDNEIELILHLAIEAHLTIKSNSEMSSFYYGNHSLSNATHLYQVQKSGASPINQVVLNISIPVEIRTSDGIQSFMQIYQPIGFQSGQSFTCQWEDSIKGYFKDAMELVEMKASYQQNYPEESDIFKKRITRSAIETGKFNEIDAGLPLNRTVFINCSSPEVICKNITCIIGPFKKVTEVATLQIKMVLNMPVITKYMLDKNDIIYLSTDGYVKELGGHGSDQLRVASILLAAVPIQEVDLWVYMVAMVTGILILLLFISGLIKTGFFKRIYKERLQVLLQAESY